MTCVRDGRCHLRLTKGFTATNTRGPISEQQRPTSYLTSTQYGGQCANLAVIKDTTTPFDVFEQVAGPLAAVCRRHGSHMEAVRRQSRYYN